MIVCQMINIENIDDIAESIPDDSKQREELFRKKLLLFHGPK